MIMKNIIFAHDNEFNREVCDKFALYFKNPEDLSHKMNLVENNLSKYQELKSQVYSRVSNHYSWLKVVRDYEENFEYTIPKVLSVPDAESKKYSTMKSVPMKKRKAIHLNEKKEPLGIIAKIQNITMKRVD
jgi:hypothetical protein